MANQFPGTNFHDLNLDWLLSEMKRISAEWVSVQEDWSDTQAAVQALHDYVMNYFSTLDISDEVESCFNAYVASGALSALVTPTAQLQASTTTTAWLADHIVQETGYVLDDTLSVANAAADAKATGDAIGAVKKNADAMEEVLSNTWSSLLESTYSSYISGSNVWSSGSRYCGIESIPTGFTKVTVTANESNYSQIAFLTNNSHTNGNTPSYATGYDNVITVPANTTKTYDIPSDATYIYYTRSFSSTNRLPQSIQYSYLYNIKAKVDVTIPLGLHEIPADTNKLNIVKRCRQMTDIKWTPGKNLPRFMMVQKNPPYADTAAGQIYKGQFKAGVEYTGIPYGQVNTTMSNYGYDYATVGSDIDFKTFVTSAANKDSMLCTRDVSAATANAHRSVAYATVCSGMVCYALGVPEVPTAQIANISGLSLIGKLNNNGSLLDDKLIKIGDVMNLAGSHATIITDIIRDSTGALTWIEISDASSAGLADSNYSDGQVGGLCRRKGWSRTALYQSGSWGDYSIYRYSGTVTYTPSPYVNVGDEFNCQRIEHYPCMPYEGEAFVYKSGHIPNNKVKILISHGGYGYLQVFKDDQEIEGSPFAIEENATSIDITEIGTGSYRANMVNINDSAIANQTYWCTWTVSE